VIVVRSDVAARKVSIISRSAKASTDDVTSSQRINEGFRRIALRENRKEEHGKKEEKN
jgi:hypothetical protein